MDFGLGTTAANPQKGFEEVILVAHGAFDSKSDRNNGVSALADRIRELQASSDVREIDVDEWPTFEGIALLNEPNIYIGFSNGGHQAGKIYNRVLEESPPDADLTSVQAHVIYIDFVYKGLRQVVDRAPLTFPTSVKSALCFYRTLAVGPIPPFHSILNTAAAHNELFQNIPIEADHGRMPAVPWLQDVVCMRVSAIMAGKGISAIGYL